MFYVYYYLRSKSSLRAKKGTPYYIGKGSSNRAFKKHSNINKPKNKSDIVIIASDLTEEIAFQIEKLHIKIWGKINSNNGILHNKTDGGEGISGYKLSKKQKLIISKRSKLLWSDKIFCEKIKMKMRVPKPNLRKPKTQKTKNILREINLGKKHTRQDIIIQMKAQKGKGWCYVKGKTDKILEKPYKGYIIINKKQIYKHFSSEQEAIKWRQGMIMIHYPELLK